jgi:hypothetical protein
MARFLEFAARFGTEQRCIEHLAGIRWPDGIVYSSCGGRQARRLRARPRVDECGACHRQESVTDRWLILLHHQVVEYPSVSVSQRERIVRSLINAPDPVSVLAPHARRIIVLRGHRHRDWISVCGNIVLGSAPSASLGTDGIDKFRGGFHVHQLSVTAGGLRPIATGHVRVS